MLPRLLSTLFLLLAWMAQGQELRTALPLEEGFLAAGDSLVWLDAAGRMERSRPVAVSLVSLAALGEQLYALDTLGREVLLLNAQGALLERLAAPVAGRLTALSSGLGKLWAVTDAGEILSSPDAHSWTVFDFNATYAGYYPQMAWRAVAAGGGSIMVAGIGPDGQAAVFTSSRGAVWSQRSLEGLQTVPTSLSYDVLRDRFCLTGTGGVLLEMPGCSHCNTLRHYPVDILYARVCRGFDKLLLGSSGFRLLEPALNPSSN